jgi:hypothetical protein
VVPTQLIRRADILPWSLMRSASASEPVLFLLFVFALPALFDMPDLS